MIELILLLQGLGFEVTFLPANLYAMAPYDEPLRHLGVDLVVTPETTSLRAFLKERGDAFALVLVSRLHIAATCFDEVRQACSNARVVFDTVDLQYLRLERQARLESNPTLAALAERTKAQELGIAARSDATLVVSAVERELLGTELPTSRVRCLSLIEHIRVEVPAFTERRGFFFVGGFEHPPNADAVSWFVAEVLPELRRLLPEAPFHVVGSKMPPEIRALAGDGVVIRGHVPDLEPLLRGCRLSVAPLRYGAGIKGKVVESLAWGLPCVMTSVAAEGIGLSHGEDALIADAPADFARCIAEAYDDRRLWERLSLAGRRRIDAAFSPAVARAALERLVDELGLAPALTHG